MRTIRGFFEFPIIVGLIALAVVLFHICTTEASHDCPTVISTQEACFIYVDDHEFSGADRLELTVDGPYDAWRVNLERATLYAYPATGKEGRIWITPRDGNGRCHVVGFGDDPKNNPVPMVKRGYSDSLADLGHCTPPADWDGTTTIDWDREASTFLAHWYDEDGWIGTREYFVCDNYDCGEPAKDDRTPPVKHRDVVGECVLDEDVGRGRNTETGQFCALPAPTPAPTPVTTPTVKVNETTPKPTVTYTEVPNPDYAALLKKLEQLKFDIAALEADIASTPRTISVRVDQIVDEPASTVESEPDEVHLWVWTESDLDTSYDPPKITPERIRAWRNSGSTEQCFDASYLQHFDKKYSVHQHACKD